MDKDYLEEMKSLKDFDAFFKLKCQKDSVLWSGFSSEPDYDRLKEYVQKSIINNPSNHLFLFKDGRTNDVMGYCQFNKETDEIAEGRGSGLFKQYQGCGLASVMNKLLLEKAKEYGFHYIYGWCSENNEASKKALIDSGHKKTDISVERYISILGESQTFYKWEAHL